MLICFCKHNYDNMRGKKKWRKVNCASLSTHRTHGCYPSPFSSPWFAVLQTLTLCFSSLNKAQVKLTHLLASLDLLPPHLTCFSYPPLLQFWPAGSSQRRTEKYHHEGRGKRSFLICHLDIVSKSSGMELCHQEGKSWSHGGAEGEDKTTVCSLQPCCP